MAFFVLNSSWVVAMETIQFSSLQWLSCVWLFATPWTATRKPPCPSPTPGVDSNSCPLSWWCHPTISCSVVSFSSCLQSFPAPRSFQMSQFFASGSQIIGVSASTSVLPKDTQDWFPLGLTGFDLLAVPGSLKSLLQHHSSNTSVLRCSAFFIQPLVF